MTRHSANMGSRAVERGAIGDAVARNVRAVRDRRGLTQQQLSAALGELGRPLLPSAIAKVEAGERRVDVDDLVALAAALNVSVGRLLMPPVDEDDEVTVTPNKTVAGWAFWQWLEGAYALPDDVAGTLDPARDVAYQDERPMWVRLFERHPLSVAQRDLWRGTRRIVSGLLDGKPQRVKGHLPTARVALDRVAAQLDKAADGVHEDEGARRGER